LKLADQAIRREFGELAVVKDLKDYVTKTGSIVPGMEGAAEAWHLHQPMFNAYDLKPWGTVLFRYMPALDNRYHRGPKHPITGEPLLGYNFIAQRYRGTGVDSNIAIVEKANSRIWAYHAGAVGPMGPIDDRAGGVYRMAHEGRYTSLHYGNSYGLFIDDINDFVWFQPNIK
jgi:hypothetical protein